MQILKDTTLLKTQTVQMARERTQKLLGAAGIDTAALDARLLVQHVLGMTHTDMLTRADTQLTDDHIDELETVLTRRMAREPMAYITGWQEFWSLPYQVGPGCLVPRDDTEAVVELSLKVKPAATTVLDLGTGPGTLMCALLTELPKARGLAVDISDQALGYACKNVQSLGLSDRVDVLKSDWLDGVEGTFDLVVSNPPYIADGDYEHLMRDVRDHEPKTALVAGPDGLDVYRSFTSSVQRVLNPGGVLCLEIGADQAQDVIDMFCAAKWQHVGSQRDLGGYMRSLAFSKG